MTLKLNGSTDGSVSIDAPADTSPTGSDITLTLPTSAGSANQFVKNGGTAGELEFSSMVETSTGVGIGTSSPQSDLHIEDASATCSLSIVAGDTTSNSNIQFGDQDDINVGLISYNHTDNALSMRTGGSGTDVTIDSSGHLGIGHITPQFGITIAQTSDDSGAIGWEDGSNNKRASIRCDGADDRLQFHTGTGDHERMSIQANGRVNMFQVYDTAIGGTTRDLFIENGGQIGYVSSIRESKENISLLSNVDWIYQLQPSSFNYKLRDQDGEYTGEVSPELEYGLIAEDVEPIAPELCFYDEVDGEQELRGIHYKKLIVPMLKALQAANTKITTLETKVAALEAAE